MFSLEALVLCIQSFAVVNSCTSFFQGGTSSKAKSSDGAGLDDNIPEKELNLISSNQDGRIILDLYYETLCPDSRSFILRQLEPAVEQIADIFSINYIPYGKARTYKDDDYTFRCQHGPLECQGNIYHACSNNYIEDSGKKFEFIRCMMMDNYDPEAAARRCGSEYTLEIEPIVQCARGPEGKQLLAHAGRLTSKLNPKGNTVLLTDSGHFKKYKKEV
ncbi:GILT-like protein 1 isoform X2 [Eurytemora carolleeae]|uniref:GILT-like protein 1 isoform X2 n=1 Tax=Eurytemora carolleeae TaxID=1294199 RepID=UPI000C75E8D6|nr:GILT-like protein 1 isoform X2 [Eurytemora carolleeae]|eukprot:XP_023321848.1 GILT-like protein 1 isoform X2 [Eurytemora affinis]